MSINEIVKQLVEESYSIPNGWFEVYFVEDALKFSSPMTRGNRSMDLTNYVGVIDSLAINYVSRFRLTDDESHNRVIQGRESGRLNRRSIRGNSS